MNGGAAAYILNGEGKVLIVKPNYRDYWYLPGGMIDEGESPLEACKRECLEELGRSVEVGELLCIEFRKAAAERPQVTQFVFRCTFVDDEPIVLQEAELDAYKFADLPRALELLGKRTVKRLEHIRHGNSVYLQT